MYLTEILSEYANWYRDATPLHSPFLTKVNTLSGKAMVAIMNCKDIKTADADSVEYFGGRECSEMEFREGIREVEEWWKRNK